MQQGGGTLLRACGIDTSSIGQNPFIDTTCTEHHNINNPNPPSYLTECVGTLQRFDECPRTSEHPIITSCRRRDDPVEGVDEVTFIYHLLPIGLPSQLVYNVARESCDVGNGVLEIIKRPSAPMQPVPSPRPTPSPGGSGCQCSVTAGGYRDSIGLLYQSRAGAVQACRSQPVCTHCCDGI